MKTLKFTFELLLCATIFACSSDDDSISSTEGLEGQKGELILKFDNGVGGSDFIFGTNYNKSNGESFQL